MLLQWDCSKAGWQIFLEEAYYDFQYPTLKRSKTIKRMQELAEGLIILLIANFASNFL